MRSPYNSAFPRETDYGAEEQNGLSKREVAAIAAMQGILASFACGDTMPHEYELERIAQAAVDAADALFEALDA